MRERTVFLLVVVLVSATAGAGIAVNSLRSDDPSSWRAFNVSITRTGTLGIGSPINVTVSVRQGTVDPKTLWVVYLSLDMGSLDIASATPATNPWSYPTVWNLTALDLTAPKLFHAQGIPTENGSVTLYAMVWVPRGDLGTVSVDSQGHVNPVGVSLMTVETDSFWVGPSA